MFSNNYYPYSNYSKTPVLKKINISNLLDGAQKTLSVINQAIPLIYQIKPLINNAKVAFKVVNAIKDDKEVTIKKEEPNNSNSPTFFI